MQARPPLPLLSLPHSPPLLPVASLTWTDTGQPKHPPTHTHTHTPPQHTHIHTPHTRRDSESRTATNIRQILVSPYHVPGTALGPGATPANRMEDAQPPWGTESSTGFLYSPGPLPSGNNEPHFLTRPPRPREAPSLAQKGNGKAVTGPVPDSELRAPARLRAAAGNSEKAGLCWELWAEPNCASLHSSPLLPDTLHPWPPAHSLSALLEP